MTCVPVSVPVHVSLCVSLCACVSRCSCAPVSPYNSPPLITLPHPTAGDTKTSRDQDLSLETLSQDLVDLLTALLGVGTPGYEIVLVGHRWVGWLAVWLAGSRGWLGGSFVFEPSSLTPPSLTPTGSLRTLCDGAA